jgi:hypothetical protein
LLIRIGRIMGTSGFYRMKMMTIKTKALKTWLFQSCDTLARLFLLVMYRHLLSIIPV